MTCESTPTAAPQNTSPESFNSTRRGDEAGTASRWGVLTRSSLQVLGGRFGDDARWNVRYTPTSNRSNRVTVTPDWARTSPTDCFDACTDGWSSSTVSLKYPLTRPSMIFGSACSG